MNSFFFFFIHVLFRVFMRKWKLPPSRQPQALWPNLTVAVIPLLLLPYQDIPEQEYKRARALCHDLISEVFHFFITITWIVPQYFFCCCKNHKKNGLFLKHDKFVFTIIWKTLHFLNKIIQLHFCQLNWQNLVFKVMKVEKVVIDLVTPCTKPPLSIWNSVFRGNFCLI